ncbi:MAG: helix-turn-helix transcriptional regulator [Victivallales bacterium]|nr:helix-turn-helix transcriptional regulator [Victivallales bacterium]
MENFAITLNNYPRLGGIVPPLLSITYSKKNPPAPHPYRRQTLNFGIIMSAPFDKSCYTRDDKQYNATIPSFCCIQPGWNCRQANPGDCEKLYFSYAQEQLEHFPSLAGQDEYLLLPLKMNGRTERCIEEIFALCKNFEQHGNVDRLDMLCAQLVMEVIISKQKKADTNDNSDQKILTIAAYFDTHFAEMPDIRKIIRRAGLSERTFHRRWKENFRISPHSYILRRKINEACKLLLETDQKISSIASETGFSDPYYFSRIFKKYTSHSPNEYRNAH